MLSLVAYHDRELEQLYVKAAFLHGELDETIYMRPPKGFEDKTKINHVSLLKKFMYDLKQSSKEWCKKFDSFVLSIGFKKSEYDTCSYYSFENNMFVYLLIYVDDMLLISKSINVISNVGILYLI